MHIAHTVYVTHIVINCTRVIIGNFVLALRGRYVLRAHATIIRYELRGLLRANFM